MATTAEASMQQFCRTQGPRRQEQDDDSDAEESQLSPRKPDEFESQIIHSGHFMVSSPHIEHPPKKGYDFDTVNKQTSQTYHFGKASASHFSIDASLTKLFECMTIAYSGKLVSPKWKNFKGLKLLWRDKIRLNNAIWRAWYMQYVERRENPVCHFVTPLDGTIDFDVHRSAEMSSDGKSWKRRIEIVIREYHKWRTYFKKRLQKHKDDDLSSLLKVPEEQYTLFGEISPDMLRVSLCQDDETTLRRPPRRNIEPAVPMEMDPLFDMDVLMSEFSDTLFSTLVSHHSIPLPNPREIAHAGNADMIQPGLIPLQPNLDFMDSFDPLQDLFHSLRPSHFSSVPLSASPVTPLPSSSTNSQAMLSSSMQLNNTHIASPLASEPVGAAVDSAYVPNYMFTGGEVQSSHDPSVFQQLSHAPLPGPGLTPAVPYMPLTLDGSSDLEETLAPSVITHTASSTVSPHPPAPTFSQNIEYQAIAPQPAPPPPQFQSPAPCPAPLSHNTRKFARPRPIKSSSANKSRPVPRITPANPIASPHLILAAPFPGNSNTMIMTPTHLKADVVPSTRVMISSSLGMPPAFHVMSQASKSPQVIAPKEMSACPSPPNLQSSASIVSNQPGSGQGSPLSFDQVPSPQSLITSTAILIKNEPKQGRRTAFFSAEQKRQSNINSGFKTLRNLVPSLKAQSNISNAVTLQKTVEHIERLQQERQQLQEEVKRLREEIEARNTSINLYLEQLPATGVPVARKSSDLVRDKFTDYVHKQTLQDWKFWIFGIIIKPLFESFNGMVSTTSRAELYQTTLQWLDKHCSLRELRPMVLNTLRQLSKSTSILNNPSLLPEEAIQATAHPRMPPCSQER
ncbi:MLX-interacting protein isoform X1 [Synchiropus splendidus]|uniref:MLX-interacting protein isoform X1 n=2 Tax=Synchiropus splendidus TaxID=270530 RepID=UPI00237DA7B1|nr:MLX-interacting protein isoform X1 [Synchiropus splendidus]